MYIKVFVANLLCVRFFIVIYEGLYAHQISVKLFMQLLTCSLGQTQSLGLLPGAETKIWTCSLGADTKFWPAPWGRHKVLACSP